MKEVQADKLCKVVYMLDTVTDGTRQNKGKGLLNHKATTEYLKSRLTEKQEEEKRNQMEFKQLSFTFVCRQKEIKWTLRMPLGKSEQAKNHQQLVGEQYQKTIDYIA